jgi:hypothetical protein
MEHFFGKFERKIRVHTFDSSITPSLMPHAAAVKVEALLFPSLVPGTLRGLSDTSVLCSLNNLEHKLWPH